MTIGAAQANGSSGMHRRRIGLSVARDASDALLVRLFLRLAEA